MKWQHKVLNLSLALALSMTLLSFFYQPVQAAGSYFVKVSGSDIANCSKLTPCSLQHALYLAGDGDYIYVAQGTYTGILVNMIDITHSIHLLGGWDGANGLFVFRNPTQYPTVLDGQNARRVIRIRGYISPVIDGFFIRNGNASGTNTECMEANDVNGCGGAIFSYQAAPTISHNHIEDSAGLVSDNGTDWGIGGGMYILEPENGTTVLDNDIRNNIGVRTYSNNESKGGGLYVREYLETTGTVTVRGNTFFGDHAWMGGGLYVGVEHLQIIIDHNTFLNNTTGGYYGSAIYASLSRGEISHNTFSSNHDQASGPEPIIELSTSSFNFYDNVLNTNGEDGPAVEYYHPVASPLLQAYNNMVASSGSPAFKIIVANPSSGVIYFYNNTLVAGNYGKALAVEEDKTCSSCQTVGFLNNIIEGYTTGFQIVDSSTNNLLAWE